MKRIFTLLFCAALFSAANATDVTTVGQCINVLLGNNQPTALRATASTANLDANNDGVITITDVTTLIDMILAEENAQKNAPAQNIDVNKLARQVIMSETGTPDISDVDKAVKHNLKNQDE